MTNFNIMQIMWFSSGGTKSVVHTDSVDNVNCLYRGEKQFVMVDPDKYRDKVGKKKNHICTNGRRGVCKLVTEVPYQSFFLYNCF